MRTLTTTRTRMICMSLWTMQAGVQQGQALCGGGHQEGPRGHQFQELEQGQEQG